MSNRQVFELTISADVVAWQAVCLYCHSEYLVVCSADGPPDVIRHPFRMCAVCGKPAVYHVAESGG